MTNQEPISAVNKEFSIRYKNRNSQEGWFTAARKFALGLLILAIVVGVLGYLKQHRGWDFGELGGQLLTDYASNVTTTLISVVLTVLIIDWLNERRAKRGFRAQLIREMSSRDNSIVLHAIGELRAQGWHEDGSLDGVELRETNLEGANLESASLQWANFWKINLENASLEAANLQAAELSFANLQWANLNYADLRGADLSYANLHEAHLASANLQGVDRLRGSFPIKADLRGFTTTLQGANLQGAYLSHANLQGVRELTNQQLVTTFGLEGATMPDGRIYDGRFNLTLDLAFASFDTEDSENQNIMAHFYGISLEQYLAGQEWARENLADLRREAGLDPDTGLPVEPTNGVEPRPADAPASPAPRRNGHKASMVTHRARR